MNQGVYLLYKDVTLQKMWNLKEGNQELANKFNDWLSSESSSDDRGGNLLLDSNNQLECLSNESKLCQLKKLSDFAILLFEEIFYLNE